MAETFTRTTRDGRGFVTYIPTDALGAKHTHLKIDIYHSKGSYNNWHGTADPGGYWLSLGATEVHDDHITETIALGEGFGRRIFILPVPRFNAKKFSKVVAALTPIIPALAEKALVLDYHGVSDLAKAAVGGGAA